MNCMAYAEKELNVRHGSGDQRTKTQTKWALRLWTRTNEIATYILNLGSQETRTRPNLYRFHRWDYRPQWSHNARHTFTQWYCHSLTQRAWDTFASTHVYCWTKTDVRMFQARRQEMKWNGFLLKNWTFRQRKVHYVQYQYYLFYSLLIGVRTHPTRTPCLRACVPVFLCM